jgi:hypothetical protein
MRKHQIAKEFVKKDKNQFLPSRCVYVTITPFHQNGVEIAQYKGFFDLEDDQGKVRFS